MTTLRERASHLTERLAAACAAAGREPTSVHLIAVSKLHPAELIQEAYDTLGLRDFGENYAQELRDKARALAACTELRWHAIGAVQKKNAKYIAAAAYAFHALDDFAVAEELSRRRSGPPLRCYLEVNLAGEASKAGIAADEAPALAERVRALPGLTLVGLTAMPPLANTPGESRPHFRALAQLAQRLGLAELSMGTSADFEVAIEEGATSVRVGTALFGERPPRGSNLG